MRELKPMSWSMLIQPLAVLVLFAIAYALKFLSAMLPGGLRDR
ncbi:hypothetical protein [Nocardia acididurans]|nr:hypothetical protein [Nocardia acididurans]